MAHLGNFTLRLGSDEFNPIVIGGMGVDISTSALALEAARLGGLGHISDAMVPFVSDRNFKTSFTKKKSELYRESVGSPDKTQVKFDLKDLYDAQRNHVGDAVNRTKGPGKVLINVMEKLTMGDPIETLRVRLNGALDAGIYGITLSAGLHQNSMKLMESNSRFRDAKIGVIVSSDRALRIFLRSCSRVNRMPDYVVVEGPLAGGHLGFSHDDWQGAKLSEIVVKVVALLAQEGLSIPVIAAGGIFTGSDGVEMLGHGAAGVQVATRFTVTKECGLPDKVKQSYFKSSEGDVAVTSVSPTGYPIRMLTTSPCLTSNIRPNCEAFGYILGKDGTCPYVTAYEATPCNAAGEKEVVKDKVCLCYHFSKYNCYTCGHYVYRLKDTSRLLPDGNYEILSAEHVFNDYLLSEDHAVRQPQAVACAANI